MIFGTKQSFCSYILNFNFYLFSKHLKMDMNKIRLFMSDLSQKFSHIWNNKWFSSYFCPFRQNNTCTNHQVYYVFLRKPTRMFLFFFTNEQYPLVKSDNERKSECLERNSKLFAAQRIKEKVNRIRGEVEINEDLVDHKIKIWVDISVLSEHLNVGYKLWRSERRV